MDAQTQADVALLADPLVRPCDAEADSTTKCEWCVGGCLSASESSFVPLENERAHYVVPGTEETPSQVDVMLIRAKYTDTINHLFYSKRVGGVGQNWSVPVTTNIADDVSNINAGSLPDGRIYLVSNTMPNIVRDPLYVSLSSDGYAFDDVRVVASCEMPELAHPNNPDGYTQKWGCMYRYPGGAKQGGCQYPQAIAVSESAGAAAGFWVIFSVNKEDMWIAKLPYAF